MFNRLLASVSIGVTVWLCLLAEWNDARACWPSASYAQQVTATPNTFHHVHLNATDPAAACAFYTRSFEVTKQTTLADWDAVQSEDVYLLFNKVNAAPIAALSSPLWHFGWGSTNVEADYQAHLAKGVTFQMPVTRLSPGFLFTYLKAPDGALVEINTAASRAFTHTHLFSAAPLCAAEWYVKHLGASSRTPARETCEVPFAAPSEPLGVIRTPAATVRFGNVSLIIYPQQKPEKLVSPRGHVMDHIGLRVPDLAATLTSLRQVDVKVLQDVHPFGKSKSLAAFIEGPDANVLELIEVRN
jgi:catechol 2,3-dioxygenase-like lactoylglutathione lyase family enzyme